MSKIVLENFNEGDGYYKVNLAYLSKEQVEEIENIVKKWNPERRLGCMCCPLTSRNKRIEEFRKHPNMVKLYIRGGQKWFENHKDIKSTQRFNNIYELFVFTVFCQNIKEFKERFGKNLFDDGIDCKQFLEDYFKIKFKELSNRETPIV